jgi:hypothetical protein
MIYDYIYNSPESADSSTDQQLPGEGQEKGNTVKQEKSLAAIDM